MDPLIPLSSRERLIKNSMTGKRLGTKKEDTGKEGGKKRGRKKGREGRRRNRDPEGRN